MNKFLGISALFLWWFIVLSDGFTLAVADAGQANVERGEQKLSASQKLQETISLVKISSQRTWDTVKSVINQIQTQIFPPNLDFRSREEGHPSGGGQDGTGARMKDAAEKSFGTSKVAVEESAKSAARVVGEAVHKTADKEKKTNANQEL